MTIIHTAPIHVGENVLEHPPTTDERFAGFMSVLRAHGLVDEEGRALVPHKVMRGVGPNGYMYRVDWSTSA